MKKTITAIRPDFYFKEVPSLKEDEALVKSGTTEDEKELFLMSQTKGWKIFTDYVDQLGRELGDTSKMVISSGASMEEIGRNTVVITLAQDIIDRALNKVTDSVEACTNEQ